MSPFEAQPDESEAPPEGLTIPTGQNLWPNQTPIVDGVVPVEDVPQDPDLFDDEDPDNDLEMED